MIIPTLMVLVAVTLRFNMTITTITYMMDIYISHTTAMWMNMSLPLASGTLRFARPIMHAALTRLRMFTVPRADMKRYRMGIMSITWLTATYIIHMAPTVTTMGWFKSARNKELLAACSHVPVVPIALMTAVPD